LVEASWTTIKRDPGLNAFYKKLKAKKGGKRAIVAVARKLLCRIYAMVKNNQMYELNKKAA